MNEFFYNWAWWLYSILTFFSVTAWLDSIYLSFQSEKFRDAEFIIFFLITLTMLSARTPFLNWIGGGL